MPAVVEGRVQLSSSAWQGDRILIWKLYSTDTTPFRYGYLTFCYRYAHIARPRAMLKGN